MPDPFEEAGLPARRGTGDEPPRDVDNLTWARECAQELNDALGTEERETLIRWCEHSLREFWELRDFELSEGYWMANGDLGGAVHSLTPQGLHQPIAVLLLYFGGHEPWPFAQVLRPVG